MCGIAGVFASKVDENATEDYLNKITRIIKSQSYRGPDAEKIISIHSRNNSVIFGHNRLSIIDLNNNADQPMWDEDKRFCLVFNGMLYNYLELRQKLQALGYTFFSSGDSEVLLKSFIEWGKDAFNLFNGMFAAAIYDCHQEKVYLARDRFGVKPLFYLIDNNKLYFASTSHELANIFRLQPNLTSIARGIKYWCYDSISDTMYDRLLIVAPGEVLTFNFSQELQKKAHKYYCLASEVKKRIPTLANDSSILCEQIKDILEDAIKLRLRADVNLGVSLSGGVDSATIAGLTKKNVGLLSAFSFGSLSFPHTEAKLAQLSAKKIGLDLHFVYPSHKEMTAGFWQSLRLQDAPFPNFSIVAQYFVFNLAKQHKIKVMLGGQGGDEIFMGYRKYFMFYLQQLFHQKKYLEFLSFITNLIPNVFYEGKNLYTHYFNYQRYRKGDSGSSLLKTDINIHLGADVSEPLWQRQLQDIYATSLPSLLRYEDRNSMSNGIESRLPFLDYRLVELALALPEKLKMRQGWSKWSLRKIASNYIPKQVAFSRAKRGFDVSSDAWIAAGLGESMRAQLNANQAMLKKFAIKNVTHLYSNKQLSNPSRLAECIALCWLADKEYFAWN